MNKAIRIQKSEAARNRRHQRRNIAEKKLQSEYDPSSKVKKKKIVFSCF